MSEPEIIRAVVSGNLKKVRLLLERGADVNAKSRGGPLSFARTPLMFAAEAGNLEMIELLLAKGADPNAKDSSRDRSEEHQRTALHYAARGRYAEVVRRLLQARANPKPRTSHGLTPLYDATASSDLESVKALIEAGASVEQNQGQFPAVLTNAAVTWTYSTSTDSKTALQVRQAKPASDARSVEMVKYLLAHGADVNGTDELGKTALHEAASYGNLELARLLLKKGADASLRDRDGCTPLMAASKSRRAEIAELLLRTDAAVNACDEQGCTALHYACLEGHSASVKILLSAGSDPNAPSKESKTPLDICEERIQLQSRWEEDLDDPLVPDRVKTWIKENWFQKAEAVEIRRLLLAGGAKTQAQLQPSIPAARAIRRPRLQASHVDFGKASGRRKFQEQLKQFADELGSHPQPLFVCIDRQWVALRGAFACEGTRGDIQKIVEQKQVACCAEGVFLVFHIDARLKTKPTFQLAVLPTVDKYKVIQALQPSGANYDIDTDDILQHLRKIDKVQEFHLIGISFDRVTLRFGEPIVNTKKLAAALHRIPAEIISPAQDYLDSPTRIQKHLEDNSHITLFWEH